MQLPVPHKSGDIQDSNKRKSKFFSLLKTIFFLDRMEVQSTGSSAQWATVHKQLCWKHNKGSVVLLHGKASEQQEQMNSLRSKGSVFMQMFALTKNEEKDIENAG